MFKFLFISKYIDDLCMSSLKYFVSRTKKRVLLKPPTTDYQPTDYRSTNPPTTYNLLTKPTTTYPPIHVKTEDRS